MADLSKYFVGTSTPVSGGLNKYFTGAETQQQKIARLQSAAQDAESKSKQANSFGTQAGTFLGETAKGLGDAFLKTPARFLTSAAVAPVDLANQAQGKQPFTGELPFVGRTFQGQAQKDMEPIYDKAYAGDKLSLGDYGTALKPFAQVPLAALETVADVKAAKGLYDRGGIFKTGTQKNYEEALDITTKPLNKKGTVSALLKSGNETGGGFKTNMFGKQEYVPDANDKRIAQAVSGVVKGDNPVKNISRINAAISDVAENEVTPVLKQTIGAFNPNEYAARLNAIEPPRLVRGDDKLKGIYDNVKDVFLEVSDKYPKNKLGLWQARQEVDDMLERELGSGIFEPEKYGTYQRAVRDMRQATNQFIGEGVPDNAFLGKMQNLTDMYSAKSRIALDNWNRLNGKAWEKWASLHPLLSGILTTVPKSLGIGLGTYYGIKGVVNAATQNQ